MKNIFKSSAAITLYICILLVAALLISFEFGYRPPWIVRVSAGFEGCGKTHEQFVVQHFDKLSDIVFLGEVIDVEQRDMSFTLGMKLLRSVIRYKVIERFKGLSVLIDEVEVASYRPFEEIHNGEVGLVTARMSRDHDAYFAREVVGPSTHCYNHYAPELLAERRMIFKDQDALRIARDLKKQRLAKNIALFILSLSLIICANLHYRHRQKR